MRLSVDEVTVVARRVAKEFGKPLDVATVAASDGGSDHAELLLTVSGCHPEPCMVLVNVPRESTLLGAEITESIRAALAAHVLPGA